METSEILKSLIELKSQYDDDGAELTDSEMLLLHDVAVKLGVSKTDAQVFNPDATQQVADSEEPVDDLAIERELENCTWIEESGERRNEFIQRAADFNKTTADVIVKSLVSGKHVRFDTDWYNYIRMKAEPVAKPERQMVLCDCGHYVPAGMQMSTSTGTACPDCYDDMSN